MTSSRAGDPASSTGPGGWRHGIHPLSSVRVRITLAAVLVTAVAVGTAGWLLVRSVEDAQIRDIRQQLDAYLDELADRLAEGQDPQEALTSGDGQDPQEDTFLTAPVTVTDEDGQVVAQTVEPGEDGDVDVSDGDGGEQRQDGAPAAREDVNLAPVEPMARTVETPSGTLTILANAPIDQVARNVDDLTHRLTIGLPALVALVGAIAWVLVGRALRPVEAIRAEVERITGSTMHRRVPEPSTRDEVGRLARTMNTMLGRLETTAAQQRQFVSDASHELRSPVAVIRAGLEVARNETEPVKWPTIVDSLMAEESRLEALLDDLLLLAAHDENDTRTAPTRSVNLTALTSAEARRPRRVPVDLVHTPADNRAVVVAGAPDQLARALSNLVDNAARHATSVVQISLSSDHGTARVVVQDDGPGIPPKDRERVFERFTRLDDGRARHDGGSGLGLAVVRSVVTFHHGHVRVDDSPLGGARFVAELPTARHTSRPTAAEAAEADLRDGMSGSPRSRALDGHAGLAQRSIDGAG
jgi:signal transduction histidine kinase